MVKQILIYYFIVILQLLRCHVHVCGTNFCDKTIVGSDPSILV